MRSVGYTPDAILTSDGCVDAVATLVTEECCPPSVCSLDPCAIMCSFVELLPNGPLWDRAKAEAMKQFETDCNGFSCARRFEECSSLVDFATYAGLRFYNIVNDSLWPALRESDPVTAVDTLDSWLSRYGWEDCWENVCRDPRLGQDSPFSCGVFCSPVNIPEIPAGLREAVKRAIVLALRRAQLQPIKNLCGVNWVIEPLGAVLRPYQPECTFEGTTAQEKADECCGGMRWELCAISDRIDAVPGRDCKDTREHRTVRAYIERCPLVYDEQTETCAPLRNCTTKVKIWPGILAAQCIALSMMPMGDCSPPIVRCTELGEHVTE